MDGKEIGRRCDGISATHGGAKAKYGGAFVFTVDPPRTIMFAGHSGQTNKSVQLDPAWEDPRMLRRFPV